MSKSTFLFAAVAAAALMPVSAQAATAIIDFEANYTDDEVLTDGQRLFDSTGNLSFVRINTEGDNTMSVEATGTDDNGNGIADDNPGFKLDVPFSDPAIFDTESAAAAPDETLGNFFLRTSALLESENNLGGVGQFNVFSFLFDGGARRVEGQLWDIDGLPPLPSGALRTESWTVRANLVGGGTLTIDSPVGTELSTNRVTGFDGLPWTFAIESVTGENDILSVDFLFTGEKTRGIGAAFEGLVVTQAALPLAASAWMMIAALGGLGVARRFRRRA